MVARNSERTAWKFEPPGRARYSGADRNLSFFRSDIDVRNSPVRTFKFSRTEIQVRLAKPRSCVTKSQTSEPAARKVEIRPTEVCRLTVKEIA